MSDNLVKSLREKTEETDLDTILKGSLGGYTRKSVREYLSMLRRQQHDLQQSFAEELQLAQTDRERLSLELDEAQARMAAAENALANAKPLMDKAAALEKDLDEAILRIQSDATLLDQRQQALQDALQDCDILRAQLAQREAELAALRQEMESSVPACDMLSANPVAETTSTTEQPETVHLQLAMLTRERENAEKRMESVIRQEKRLFEALDECRTELENRRDQNLCLEAENKALSLRLSEQMWQNISLDREITHIRAMNENLKAKLDVALSRSTTRTAQTAGDLFVWDLEN